jgi:hypothetical protein
MKNAIPHNKRKNAVALGLNRALTKDQDPAQENRRINSLMSEKGTNSLSQTVRILGQKHKNYRKLSILSIFPKTSQLRTLKRY